MTAADPLVVPPPAEPPVVPGYTLEAPAGPRRLR